MNAANPENVAAAVPVSQPAAPPSQAEAEDEPAPPAPFGELCSLHLELMSGSQSCSGAAAVPYREPCLWHPITSAGISLTKPLLSHAVQSCHLQSLDKSKP